MDGEAFPSENISQNDTKKTYKYLIISVIVLIVVLAIVVGFIFMKPKVNESSKGKENITSIQNPVMEPFDCATISTTDYFLSCTGIKAECSPEKYNHNSTLRPTCDYQTSWLFSYIAQTTKDPKACGMITNTTKKDQCYIYLAVNNVDSTICNNIIEPSSKDKCLAEVLSIISQDTIYRDLPAKYQVAIAPTPNYTLYPDTEYVVIDQTEPNGATTSRSEVHLASLNVAECDKVKESTSFLGNDPYTMCISKIALLTGNYSTCNYITNTQYPAYKDSCLKEFAVRSGNAKSCFLINKKEDPAKESEYGYSFTDCLILTINSFPSKEGCDFLGNVSSAIDRDNCYNLLR